MKLRSFPLTLLIVQTCTALDSLPLFMLDSANVMSRHLIIQPNPFAKMSTSFFAEIIRKVVNRTLCVVVFVEDTLSAEDVSAKDEHGSPFRHLRQGLLDKKVQYIPAAAFPYRTLTQHLKKLRQNIFHLSLGVKVKFHDTLKYLYVFFRDGANLTRVQSLRQHDAIMHEVYLTLRHLKVGPIIGFYTGISNPVVIAEPYPVPGKRRKNAPLDPDATIGSKRALFRLSGVFSVSSSRRSALNQRPVVARERWTRSGMSSTVAYSEFELKFKFRFRHDSWLLDYVSLYEGDEEVGRRSMKVGAPWHWSYICGDPLSIYNTRDGSTITITKYQIQPMQPKYLRQEDDPKNPDDESNDKNGKDPDDDPKDPDDDPKDADDEKDDKGDKGDSDSVDSNSEALSCFGKTVHCGPYFNTNILSGLFISFICIAITAYGVLMLFNCSSNDKFDDPNGKEVMVKGDGGS